MKRRKTITTRGGYKFRMRLGSWSCKSQRLFTQCYQAQLGQRVNLLKRALRQKLRMKKKQIRKKQIWSWNRHDLRQYWELVAMHCLMPKGRHPLPSMYEILSQPSGTRKSPPW